MAARCGKWKGREARMTPEFLTGITGLMVAQIIGKGNARRGPAWQRKWWILVFNLFTMKWLETPKMQYQLSERTSIQMNLIKKKRGEEKPTEGWLHKLQGKKKNHGCRSSDRTGIRSWNNIKVVYFLSSLLRKSNISPFKWKTFLKKNTMTSKMSQNQVRKKDGWIKWP